jgi:Fur family ferric uptake transcriptional regulator
MRQQPSDEPASDASRTLKAPLPVTEETILQAFGAIGLRSTEQRRLIAQGLVALAETGRSFTIKRFWQQLQRKDAHIGYATVYRALDVLLESELLVRLEFPDGTHRYRVQGPLHQHYLTCTECRQIVAIQICLPKQLFARVARDTGFTLASHSIELFGRCPRCRAAREDLSEDARAE